VVYVDFVVSIRLDRNQGYRVEARSAARGEATAALALDPRGTEMEEARARLEIGTVADGPFLEAFGARLFRGLLPGAVGRLYDESVGYAQAVETRGLRLRLDVEPPEVASLPWEFLYDPERALFVAASPATTLTRYIFLHEPIRELRIDGPVRVLVVIPAGSGLNTAEETRLLRTAFATLGSSAELRFLEDRPVTPAVLRAEIAGVRCHILHFIGHGAFEGGEACLYLNDERGAQVPLPADAVARLVAGEVSLKLVVLNACQGAAVSATAPMVGLAPQLVRRGVPAVVAMRYPIADDVAIVFAREFYRALWEGPESGLVDAAISDARRALWQERGPTRTLGTPVLFLRAPEGVIFDRAGRGQSSPALRAVANAYQENLTIRETLGGVEEGAELAADREGLARTLTVLRRRMARVVAVAALVFAAAWVSLFGILGLDEHLEHALMWAGTHLAPPPWHAALALVVVDHESVAALGPGRGGNLRSYHAQVLPRLGRAGARAIVFDVVFREETLYDRALAAAIRETRASGTAVVAAPPAAQQVGMVADLVPELRDAVTEWGRADKAVGFLGTYVRKMRLVELSGEGVTPVWFLGLRAVSHALSAPRLEVSRREDRLTLADGDRHEIPIARMTSSATGRRLTGPSSVSRVAEIYVRFSPLAALRQRSLPYQRLVDEPEASPWWQMFRGKVVLIGIAVPGDDEHFVFWGEKRHGVEILADGINTVLEAQFVRPVAGTLWHLGLLLLLGLTGATLRLRLAARRRARRVTLVAVALVYVAAGLVLHLLFLFVPAIAYDLLALGLGYWAVGLARGRLARTGGTP
jgi:CHASE2 domain-containing sensor protein